MCSVQPREAQAALLTWSLLGKFPDLEIQMETTDKSDHRDEGGVHYTLIKSIERTI